jgi:hypothetical protein
MALAGGEIAGNQVPRAAAVVADSKLGAAKAANAALAVALPFRPLVTATTKEDISGLQAPPRPFLLWG